MSAPRGIPRTETPAAGLPSASRTRPMTVARGLARIRRVAAVGVGAVAHAAETIAARRSASAGLTERDYVIIAAVSETVETHRFEVAAAWSGDAAGMGRVSTEDGALQVPVAGAVVLGGSGGKA